MKYCVDCKWINEEKFYETVKHYCTNPKLGTDVVTGKLTPQKCAQVRSNNSQCGLDAVWFIPKEQDIPWYKKFITKSENKNVT